MALGTIKEWNSLEWLLGFLMTELVSVVDNYVPTLQYKRFVKKHFKTLRSATSKQLLKYLTSCKD